MGLKITFGKGVNAKVTVLAGKAKHEYTGLNEIPETVRDQLRFFGHWDEIKQFLPITAGFNNKAMLQEAVQLAARGDCSHAQVLMGVAQGCDSSHARRFVPLAPIEGEYQGTPLRLPHGEIPAREPIPLSTLLEIPGLNAGSPADTIKQAPNTGKAWEQRDIALLTQWCTLAHRQGKVVNCVTAGRLLGRTPFAVLCKMTVLSLLDESTAYKVIDVLNAALRGKRTYLA
jgi:hypothetical protein